MTEQVNVEIFRTKEVQKIIQGFAGDLSDLSPQDAVDILASAVFLCNLVNLDGASVVNLVAQQYPLTDELINKMCAFAEEEE